MVNISVYGQRKSYENLAMLRLHPFDIGSAYYWTIIVSRKLTKQSNKVRKDNG